MGHQVIFEFIRFHVVKRNQSAFLMITGKRRAQISELYMSTLKTAVSYNIGA